jgi:hypothetical protein
VERHLAFEAASIRRVRQGVAQADRVSGTVEDEFDVAADAVQANRAPSRGLGGQRRERAVRADDHDVR